MQRYGKPIHQFLTRVRAATMNDQAASPPQPEAQRSTDVKFRVKGLPRHSAPNH